MNNRIKLIYEKQIDDLDNYLCLEEADCISIFYENKNIVLAVYGHIFGSHPHKTINIKLSEMSKEFSDIHEIKDFITNGTTDSRLSRQKEIINICLFGNEIKKKVRELDVSIREGKTQIEIKCSSNCAVAIKNYAEKKLCCKVTKTGSKVIINKN